MQESAHPGEPLSRSERTRTAPHAPHERRGGPAWGGYLVPPGRSVRAPKTRADDPTQPTRTRQAQRRQRTEQGEGTPRPRRQEPGQTKEGGGRGGAHSSQTIGRSRGVTRRGEGRGGLREPLHASLSESLLLLSRVVTFEMFLLYQECIPVEKISRPCLIINIFSTDPLYI